MSGTPTSRLTRATGAELRRFGEELAASGDAQVGDRFTNLPAADELVKSEPNAFLLGVLFTQGIPAERAWAGPYLLRERLGHLDLRRLAAERDAVDAAVSAPPALHRFKHTVAGWISDAAARLLDCYAGDASRIWRDATSAAEVSERLSVFRGIGRKKAAMTVEILRRHFRVPLEAREGNVAYDVHVRRVFLRTGLVDSDNADAIEHAAREACPEAPGMLDLPAWLVGRRWCRPRGARCDDCRLGSVCLRRTWVDVEGVGVRR